MPDFPAGIHDLGPRPMSPAPLPHTGGKVSVVGARRVAGAPVYEAADVGEGVFTTAGGVIPPGPPGGTIFGKVTDLTPGLPWFDHVHILPRTAIDFGNIVTTVQGSFELFSAYRTSTTLTTFVNNAGVGVEVPDLPALPFILGGYASILGPTSTRLNPVELVVQATAEGQAQFDDTLDFTFAPGGLLMLRVQGNRIALIPFDYEQGFDEVLDFGGEVLTRIDGTDQRIDERNYPVQSFDRRYLLEGREKRRMKALLFEWQARQFALPIKEERMFLTQAVSSGLIVNVDNTDDVDLRIGGPAVVFQNNWTFDVLQVVSKTSTTITFASEVQKSFNVGDTVAPVRLALGRPSQRGSRPPNNLEEFRVRFTVVDNHTGALTGDTSAFSSFGGLVLLDDCNLIEGSASIERRISVTIIDNGVGRPFQEPVWSKNKRAHPKAFLARSRAELLSVRRLLIALGGPQTSFYIPTFDDDLLVTQDIGSSFDTMTIENIGYTRFVQSREPKATFRITFTDGTDLERTILSSVELSVDEEELTLDTTWGTNRTVAEIVRVEFYERVRMANPRVRIRHERIGSAKVQMPVVAVFD